MVSPSVEPTSRISSTNILSCAMILLSLFIDEESLRTGMKFLTHPCCWLAALSRRFSLGDFSVSKLPVLSVTGKS